MKSIRMTVPRPPGHKLPAMQTPARKPYSTPEIRPLEVETREFLLAASVHGRENACLHGSHAWFCLDDGDGGDDE